jgi:hypothetical protein
MSLTMNDSSSHPPTPSTRNTGAPVQGSLREAAGGQDPHRRLHSPAPQAPSHLEAGAVTNTAARRQDALRLLLDGPFANTTFEWSSYTQADIAAAAEALQARGLDAHQAVVDARAKKERGSQWVGVGFRDRAWRAQVTVSAYAGGHCRSVNVSWKLPHAEAAACQADCGFLATRGLGCTTNFPASSYSQEELEEAGQHAVRGGVDAAAVRENLGAVKQVGIAQ